ncbi:hypothetical protein K438DRAFT_1751390 [Mycena galopus ATCC 62051]|nr:hypothetical protein K438DRAFT_1751390 [Mycena galopus ATCC 62051]
MALLVGVQPHPKKSILEVFASHAEQSISERLPVKDRVTDFGTARKDILQGYRPKPMEEPSNQVATKSRKKKKAVVAAVKDVLVSKVVLFVSGVKHNILLGSSKSPSHVDIDHMALHKCVAVDVTVKPGWTHEQSTEHFAGIFSEAFEQIRENKAGGWGGSWVVLSKEYKTLRVVPNREPNGADLVTHTIPKTANNGAMIFIGNMIPIFCFTNTDSHLALRKGISTETYKSWNTRQDIAETSSDGDADVILSSNDDDEESANDSEYNPAKDPDADAMNLEPVQSTPVGKYSMRIDPLPSKRKSEAVEVDSDTEQPRVTKKLKLAINRRPSSQVSQVASSSKQPCTRFLH